MTIFLAILLVAAMIATLAALIRGIVVFLQVTEADLKGTGPSVSGIKSNKAMQFRIFFQALAIMIVVLILFVTGRT
jgi:hypothetical protein